MTCDYCGAKAEDYCTGGDDHGRCHWPNVPIRRLPEAPRRDYSDGFAVEFRRGVDIGGVGKCKDGRYIPPAKHDE